MSNSLHMSADKTQALLELILPDNHQGEEGPILSGTISFADLHFDITTQNKADRAGKLQCVAPSAQLVIQANPFRKQYTVEELTLESPRLVLTDNENNGKSALPLKKLLSLWPSQLLDPASLPFDLKIRRLAINNGTLQKEQGSLWEDLQLEMTAYRNRETADLKKSSKKKQATKATALSFSAHQGATTVQFQGTTNPDLNLTGTITFHNLDSSLLQPYLNAREDVQLVSGQAELSGLLRTVQAKEGGKKKILLEKGTITLRDIRLKRKKQGKENVLLTAQRAESKGCSIELDPASPSLSCTSLLLHQANFSPDAPSFFLFPETAESPLGLSVETVKITDATASLRLGSKQNGQSGLTIPLTALNLEIKDLRAAQSKKANLHFQAGIGTDGKVTADALFAKERATSSWLLKILTSHY
ncbi:hypothetical protein H206_02029 [Candidatus Electrothrix aarhusensis]|uniref:AsmA family protein n=1 Tax=Candidatus Electrothrix aarhusensis TaxID=1859131 RepID=A0A444IT87_9BACT|nr:hypothetical protein H206_02029 [Candidatus Electrothrix aarhusensis]